eukprot:3744288-Pyramimonas_sp.AAC.1
MPQSELASVGVLADSYGWVRFAADFRRTPGCLGARRCPGVPEARVPGGCPGVPYSPIAL